MITLRPLLRAAALSALTLASLAVQAQVSVKEPWVRATVAQQKTTGAFMQISSTEPVRLVEAKSTAARIVEIHEMRMEGDRMMMKAIDALDLLVVVDTMSSEITGYADVVLPEVTFLERHDQLLTGFGRHGWLSLRQPVMPAPQGSPPSIRTWRWPR